MHNTNHLDFSGKTSLFLSIILSVFFVISFSNQTSAHEISINKKIAAYDFSLKEIEEGCEVYRKDSSTGYLECIGNLSMIERKCDVSFQEKGLADIDCRGNDLLMVQQRCTINLYSKNYGNITCQ